MQKTKIRRITGFPPTFLRLFFLLRQAPQKNERKEGEEREVENPFPSYVTSPYNLADKKGDPRSCQEDLLMKYLLTVFEHFHTLF